MRCSDVIGDRIHYKMSKNDKVDSLKIPLVINQIIIKYYKEDKKSSSNYIFLELKTVSHKGSKDIYSRIKSSIKRFNSNLKTISELAEIDKKITNHIARHSFGNIAGGKVSPQMLQKSYRHTHLSTTRISR
ncbi:tyrosine-type recombinase/integrase [Changchengzhania lutea]|uniref:tyrosine-type recombinase/integrase n=1 Tax=Changchengzhania lutea TaxID=2049305 RepID=UPI001FE85052|nr:tyrosine-type recombinase/integrase [Changchengzhania lutea]